MTLRKFIIFFAILLAVLYSGKEVSAYNLKENCSFADSKGNNVCTRVVDYLPDGAARIEPNQGAFINFAVYKPLAGDNAPDCQEGRNLYNVVRHYFDGSATNYEYLPGGSEQDIGFGFDSGPDGQLNRYAGVFYCWTSSLGTSKAALDAILGPLSAENQAWLSPEFNLITGVPPTPPPPPPPPPGPDCSQISSCSGYSVQGDCTANECNLSPACQWTGSACITEVIPPPPPPGPDCSQISSCSGYSVQGDCTANECNLSPACQWTGSACITEVIPPPPPPPSPPTASITANGQHNIYAVVDESITYNWLATNANQYVSSLVVSPSSPDPCGNKTGFVTYFNSQRGSLSQKIKSCQVGYSYTFTYTAIQTSTGATAKDSVTITVALPDIDLTAEGVFNIIAGLACWFTRVSFIFLVIFIILAGLRFMHARGNPAAFLVAKKNFIYVFIGLLVILGVYYIIATVANAVGITDFSFIPLFCY